MAIKSGILEISLENGKSYASRMYSSYPIRFIQTCSYCQNCASVFVLGYGGGIVSGDEININTTVNANACLCLRTQGSTKIFKSCEINHNCKKSGTSQNLQYELLANSLLVLIPDPITLFESAVFRQVQSFSLDSAASSLVFVDWYTSGRSSRGERWAFTRLLAKTRLSIGGELVFLENLDLHNSAMGSISDKVGDAEVFGTVLMVGHRSNPAVAAAKSAIGGPRQSFRDVLSASNPSDPRGSDGQTMRKRMRIGGSEGLWSDGPLVSMCDLRPGVTLVRFAANKVEDAYGLLANILSPLELEIGFVPYADRLHRSS